ncbi:MAG TPA: ABC transporter permease subunit [Chloroflexota bacterium]|jgi:NitT/TauT family transport system permease protein
MRQRLVQLAVLLGLLLVWQAVVLAGVVRPSLLPAPTTVAAALVTVLGDRDVVRGLQVTTLEVAVTVLLTVPLAVLLGMVIGESARATRWLAPAFYFLTAVPKSIFLPLFILALGVGLNEKVAFGVFQAAFVILVATIAAVQGVPRSLVLAARAMGARRHQIYWHVYLPHMLPVVLQGVRIGIVFGITGIVLAEMYVTRDGFGRFITLWGTAYQMPELLAGVTILGGTTILINELLRAYERRAGRWRVQE